MNKAQCIIKRMIDTNDLQGKSVEQLEEEFIAWEDYDNMSYSYPKFRLEEIAKKYNMKPYKRIRLEFNEGKIQHPTIEEERYKWRESVKDLPQQDRPDTGYHKHYYEIELHNGEIIKFRLDVESNNYKDTHITEEEVKKLINNRLNK